MLNSRKQTGSVWVPIVIILVVGIIGILGYVFWTNYLARDDNSPVVETANTERVVETNEASTIDDTIHEVDIRLASESDLDKLPMYTPASFKEYMRGLLSDNTPRESMIDNSCTVITTYWLTKISQVNIEGGTVPTDINDGRTCPGGAPFLWVLAPSGVWDRVDLNGLSCESENGGLVYEEFATVCYQDPVTREMINNPNGSIKSINS